MATIVMFKGCDLKVHMILEFEFVITENDIEKEVSFPYWSLTKNNLPISRINTCTLF
ncbi:hypothetical protein TCEA9_11600 [Thermobrachium celere]|nr:hypothetical protein TCEA9_11600 [Thermobrachium celere]